MIECNNQWIQLNIDTTSLNRIGWELEKDWSVFIAGDVSFSLTDTDGTIQSIIGEGNNRVKIYGNFSSYSYNEDVGVFAGRIKPDETQIKFNIVTYYCQSIYSSTENDRFYGRYNGTDPVQWFSGIMPLRLVLKTDYELNWQGYDFSGVKLFSFDRTKLSIYQMQAMIARASACKDMIYESSDSSYYYYILAYIDISSVILRRSTISKTDPTDINEGDTNLASVSLGATPSFGDAIRIVKSCNVNYKYIIFIKGSLGSLYAIIKINNDWTYDMVKWNSSDIGAPMNATSAVFNSASLSEDGTLLCVISYGSIARFITKIDPETMELISYHQLDAGWNSINVLSAELTNYAGGFNYGFLYTLGYFRFFAIFKFTTGVPTVYDNDVIVTNTNRVFGSGMMFCLNGLSQYYNANNGQYVAFPGTVGLNIIFASEYFEGSHRYITLFEPDQCYTRMFNYVSGNSLTALIDAQLYDIYETNLIDTLKPCFYKYKIIDYAAGVLRGGAIAYFQSGQIFPYAYILLTRACPFLIDFTSFTNLPTGISVKDALKQMLGSYFSALYIPDWILIPGLPNREKIQVLTRPRISGTCYEPSADNIILDSIKVVKHNSYKVSVTSQGQTATSGGGIEEISFNYDCLPIMPPPNETALLQNIADFIVSHFENTYEIEFKADCLIQYEIGDWMRITDNSSGITYEGIIVRNEIDDDFICDMRIIGKEVEE
jgi:hypothetical protein